MVEDKASIVGMRIGTWLDSGMEALPQRVVPFMLAVFVIVSIPLAAVGHILKMWRTTNVPRHNTGYHG